MDKSLINQTNLDFSNGLGNAKINIYNGRLLYELPCLKIGAGNFEIATSLIYNSHYKVSDFGSKIIGFGNGFKLNIHQYVFPYVSSYNINEFQVGDYVYIDEVWNTHRFVLYKTTSGYDNNSSVYYDASGSGLRLLVRNNGHSVIYDGNMNSLLFNSYGMLENIVSAINPLISKTITYNGTNISSIYDSRKSSRRINFTYNNGKLSSISISNNGTFLNFDYDDTLISKISKSISSKSKDLVFFLYDNYRLNYIVSAKDLLSLSFYYDNSSNKRVVTLKKGVMRKEIITSQSESCNYVGENNHIGENIYVKNKGMSKVGENLSMPSNYVKNETRFSYGSFFTDVTNDKNITIRYMFNVNGFTSSIFEYDSRNNDYKTLFKTNGWTLSNESIIDEKINGKNIIQLIPQINNEYLYEVNSNNINSFKNIFNNYGIGRKSKYFYSQDFVVSFWIKTLSDLNSSLIATFSYSVNNQTMKFSSYLDKTKGNSWQYVSMPVKFDYLERDISSFKLEISGDYYQNIYIGDLRIAVGNSPEIFFVGRKNININDFLKIKIVENHLTNEYDLSANVFLTESDIFATYKSMFYAQKENKNSYDFVYCNGTKVKNVESVSLFTRLFIDYNFEDENVVFAIDDNGTPNYYIKTDTTIDEGKRNVVETINRFYKSNDSYYFEVNNYAQLKEGYDGSERVYQPFCARKSIQRFANGLIRQEEDEYQVFNDYEYDVFGNLLSIKRKSINDYKKIIFKYDYCNVLPINREFPQAIIINGIRKEFSYYEPEMNKEYDIIGNNKQSYFYDDYKERITKINSINTSSLSTIYNNNYYYDNFGRLKSVTDQSNRTIGYLYNVFGEPIKYFENGKLISEKNINHYDSYDIIIDKLYNNEKSIDNDIKIVPFITETKVDSYGRILCQKNINDSVETTTLYKYQDDPEFSDDNSLNGESKIVSKIRKINDPYENMKYSYSYDEENRPSSYAISDIINESIKLDVRQIGANDTEYCFNDASECIVSKVTQEDSEYNQNTYPKFFEPRIKRTKYVKFNERNSNEAEEIYKDYNYEYSYDVLGRLTSKVSEGIADGNNLWDNKIYINKEIEYKDIDENETTIFPKKISYTIHSKDSNSDDTASIAYDNVFDSRGNIVLLERSGERFDENPVDEDYVDKSILIDRKHLYDYDAFNRVTRERKYEDSTLIETIEYDYAQNSDKLRRVKKNNNVIKEFSYTNGRVTKYKKGSTLYDIDYDNYGNIRKTNCASIEYDSRNLLKKYTRINNNDYQNTNYSMYSYDYQGVRFGKYVSSLSKRVLYYNDGNKVLGEDWTFNDNSDSKIIRYFYDAEGICGLSYDGCNFNFIKDSLGNVTKVLYQGKIIGEYIYDAWGNSTVVELSISNDPVNGARDRFVLYNNPFRWKSYYLDVETNLYYINGRYYSPELMLFLNALEIERVNISNLKTLNRNSIVFDNIILFPQNNDAVFTSNQMYSDPSYDEFAKKTWWQANWKKAICWIAFGTVFLVSFVLMCIPVTSEFGIGMFLSGLDAAMSGVLIGGLMGGIINAIQGNGFLEGAVEGAVYGFISGFVIGATLYCVGQLIKYIIRAVNCRKVPLCENETTIEPVVEKQVHGNSLKSTKTNYGYRLVDVDTNEILKYGESLYREKRYTSAFYRSTNSKMEIIISGSKAEVHVWQHEQIINYFNQYGKLPRLNKSFW